MLHRQVFYLILISSTALKCNSYRFAHYGDDYDDSEEHTPDHAGCHHTHRIHGGGTVTHHEPRSIDRSETSNDFAKDVRPINERSGLDSGVLKAQEEERRRLQPRVAEPLDKVRNGSHKIVNDPIGFAKRRGQADAPSTGLLFEGPTIRSSPLVLVPDVPEECKKIGICENVPNYPKQHVDTILENLGEEKLKLKVDEMDIPEVVQRFGSPDEEGLCDDIERVMIPQAAPDKYDKWYFIVNQKETPLQGFHVNICRNDNSPCSNNAVSYRPGYKATCKQKYVLRYLASIAENGTLVQRHFKLPSCCTCVIKRDF